ncbi:uncharacterized protein UHOR_14740 [Ustilago hordei]|uniref:Uncharacterized protein n=1 Tax=Ustilago hordei TaxID=120017 RepID=I2FVR8_USTHO|nr:uncharacterized protein UHOR_14740 [Ustilago hordei]
MKTSGSLVRKPCWTEAFSLGEGAGALRASRTASNERTWSSRDSMRSEWLGGGIVTDVMEAKKMVMVGPCEEEGTSDDDSGERCVLIEKVVMSMIVMATMMLMMLVSTAPNGENGGNDDDDDDDVSVEDS